MTKFLLNWALAICIKHSRNSSHCWRFLKLHLKSWKKLNTLNPPATLDRSSLVEGVYIIQVKNDGSVFYRKNHYKLTDYVIVQQNEP